MTMFPAASLVASGGEIYCHLFENPRTGLPRNIYWSITIDFQPIQHLDQQWRCSMTCEWLTWALRDWRELAGQSLDLTYGENGSESSFYTWQHDIGKSTRLRIGARHGDHFDVSMGMIVDFAGVTETDSNPALQVRGQAVIPYTGVIVVPDNLAPPPRTPADVSALVSGFLDTSLHTSPKRREHAFRMKPMPGI